MFITLLAPLFSFTQLIPYFISLILFLILYEQILYIKKKSYIPGPSLVFPFFGNAISLARNPTKFWSHQITLARSTNLGLSANYILGNFIVFIRDTELSHKVFANVRPDAFLFVGFPFGKKLFGERNIIYMMGQEHKNLRRRIAPNFTPNALSTYAMLQQIIILKHIKTWVKLSNQSPDPIPLRNLARDLNLDSSETVFLGPYLSSNARESFERDYLLFNEAFTSLPIDFPGTAFRNGRLAVVRLEKTLATCTGMSKARMEKGEEPSCLIDYWMQDTLREIAQSKLAGDTLLPPFSSDVEIASYLFDFFFAAQDASMSAMLWAVAMLDVHPKVLAKVREEVSGIWSSESNALITAEQLRDMKYTQAVAREVVRYRPPTFSVPHVAAEEFELTESYTIPKGAIVFPCTLESSFQGFTESKRFDPDRFSEERQEEHVYKRNFLAFGAGSHQCVGQKYALNNLVLFIAMFVTLVDFKRDRSEGCDEYVYVPTIAPKDDCRVLLSRRCARYPSFPSVEQIMK
ncbi:hypothetical protein RIF29_40534 [Crotalaria pallida]|uniref:sterol 22-desaturase n=1 Tax=Crotalaria pallida TaxID=3830 RepID=A0AAN9HNJ6_CROPI